MYSRWEGAHTLIPSTILQPQLRTSHTTSWQMRNLNHNQYNHNISHLLTTVRKSEAFSISFPPPLEMQINTFLFRTMKQHYACTDISTKPLVVKTNIERPASNCGYKLYFLNYLQLVLLYARKEKERS